MFMSTAFCIQRRWPALSVNDTFILPGFTRMSIFNSSALTVLYYLCFFFKFFFYFFSQFVLFCLYFSVCYVTFSSVSDHGSFCF